MAICSAIAGGRKRDALEIIGREGKSLQFIESAKVLDRFYDSIRFEGLDNCRDPVDALIALDDFLKFVLTAGPIWGRMLESKNQVVAG